MRPIVGFGGGNVYGANANAANPRPLIVLRRGYMVLRLGEQSIAPSGPPAAQQTASSPGYGTGLIARNATFKDSSGQPSYLPLGRPIGAMRWRQPFTGPVAIALMKPKLRGISRQVTNTDVRHRLPGWTYSLPINTQTKIGQAMRRPYLHTGA